MDFSTVKLVVSDMDGTLLNSKGEVSNHFFHLYEELKKQHIQFVAASGRQYQSIVDKLDSIKNEITIIAENGGITQQAEKVLLLNDLSFKNRCYPFTNLFSNVAYKIKDNILKFTIKIASKTYCATDRILISLQL